MANEVQVSLRVPADTIKAADQLIRQMQSKPELAAYRVTRASVLRQAVIRGLSELAEENKRTKRGRG